MQLTKVPRLKVLSAGNSGVGKSCLIKRFCEGRFEKDYIATIGIDYGVKPMPVKGELGTLRSRQSCSAMELIQNTVHIDIWDTAGDEIYYEIRNEFYHDFDGVGTEGKPRPTLRGTIGYSGL